MTTINTSSHQDMPPLTWSSASAAFKWAEETASRPNYKNPLAAMQGSVISGNVSGWTQADFLDLAYSILTVIANIEDKPAREIFRYMHGVSIEKQIHLSSLFGEQLQEKHLKKTYGQLKKIAEIALMRERFVLQGRKKLGMEFYAAALGIQRPSLYSGDWQMIIRDAEEIVSSVLHRGTTLARFALSDLEVLS